MTVRKRNKLIHGVGINDAGYVVEIRETSGHINGKQKQKTLWSCPFYSIWAAMLQRCYSQKWHMRRPTYIGCTVVDEWKTFSKFKAWMEKQDWEGNQLDKDLIFHGNKEYCPTKCVFISRIVNLFLTESTASRGQLPIGVSWKKPNNKFQARCGNPFTKKQEFIGYYDNAKEAHQAWLKRKLELAHQLAALQTDPRVAKALIDRYDVDEYIPLHT